MHCNVIGPSRVHVQPSVQRMRPSPSSTRALSKKRLLTHAEKGKIYAKGMFTSLRDKISVELNSMA